MCANHPIDPRDMLAPIPTAVPPETEETTEHTEDTEDDRDFARALACPDRIEIRLVVANEAGHYAYIARTEPHGNPGIPALAVAMAAFDAIRNVGEVSERAARLLGKEGASHD